MSTRAAVNKEDATTWIQLADASISGIMIVLVSIATDLRAQGLLSPDCQATIDTEFRDLEVVNHQLIRFWTHMRDDHGWVVEGAD